jgi:hypothetical protein
MRKAICLNGFMSTPYLTSFRASFLLVRLMDGRGDHSHDACIAATRSIGLEHFQEGARQVLPLGRLA